MVRCPRRYGRLLCTGLYFFFSGVEYAVILPTLNGYLNSLEAPPRFIGVLMASFSFSGLITSPIYGLVSDKTRSSKVALLLSNLFEIGGNFLYFTGNNFYVVWLARLVAGVGSGSGSTILGMLARTTTSESRTFILSSLMSMRQVGLVIGPAFNIFFHGLDSTCGPFAINEFSSPGLLMAGIWLIHTMLVVFLYNDDEEDTVDERLGEHDSSPNDRRGYTSPISLTAMYNEFLREEVILCLALTFIIMFMQLGVETAVTPLTSLLFGWDGLYNSFFYCAAGLTMILSFAALSALSRRIDDRQLIATGLVLVLFSFLGLLSWSIPLYMTKDMLDTPPWVFPAFIATVCLLVVGLPFAYAPMASLYSKITSMESQGFNQGVRLVVLGIGQILGPIWAAPMATLARLPYFASVSVLLTALLLVMLSMSYSKLRPRIGRNGRASVINSDTDAERTQLIRGTDSTDTYGIVLRDPNQSIRGL